MLMYRLIENYEHQNGSFVSTESIVHRMKGMESESEIPDRSVVGKIIAQIWGTKIVKCKTSSVENGSGYKNLGLRPISPNGKEKITAFDEETINAMRRICEENDGWMIDDSSLEKGIICLLKASRDEGPAGVTVDNRSVRMELNINVRPKVSMTLRTHSKPVPIEDIFGSLRNEDFVSLDAIVTALRLLNSTSVCLGGEIATYHNEPQDSELQQPVLGSRLARVSKDGVDTNHLISSSCLLMVSIGMSACEHCVYAKRLFRNRFDKRKRVEHVEKNTHKRNDRYLNRSGLENKISLQKKERQASCKGKKAEDDMLVFEESDHKDLLKILEQVDNSEIPEDMKLLWSMQMRQLSSKSPKGYRWDPRLVKFNDYFSFN